MKSERFHARYRKSYVNGFIRHCIRQAFAVCSTYLCKGNGRAWCAMRAARRQEQTFQRRIPVKEDTVKRRARLTFQCAEPHPTTWRCAALLIFAMHCGLLAHLYYLVLWHLAFQQLCYILYRKIRKYLLQYCNIYPN